MKPSVGRIVHYASYGTPGGEYGIACRAAVITADTADVGLARIPDISLCVINPAGLFFNQNVRYHEGEPLKHGEVRDDLCGAAGTTPGAPGTGPHGNLSDRGTPSRQAVAG